MTYAYTDPFYDDDSSCFGDYAETMYEKDPVVVFINGAIYKVYASDYSAIEPTHDAGVDEYDIETQIIDRLEESAASLDLFFKYSGNRAYTLDIICNVEGEFLEGDANDWADDFIKECRQSNLELYV